MKVFIVTDMEGVTGVVSFTQQSYPDGKYYEQARLRSDDIRQIIYE